MKIFVTGAGGFIGHILADGLQQGGHEVIGLYRSSGPRLPSTGIVRLEWDLSRGIPLADEVDYIVHCAALQNPSGISVKEFIDTNLAMTENVLLYAKRSGVKGVIFTSSVSLHGEVRSGLVSENTDRVNPSVYGVSKYLCELMLRDCAAQIPSVSLRLCGVIGSGADKCWLANLLAKAVRGEDIQIVNKDGLFNNVVHTDDLLQLLLSLLANGFSGFNAFPIASKSPVSIAAVVNEIISATGSCSKMIDNGLTANSFTISNDVAVSGFHYQPSGVVDNLQKFVKEMGGGKLSSKAEQ